MSSLYLSNDQLDLCEQLKQIGFPQEISPGVHLGRGFADLGYEQFVVLPAEKILSLFTGDIIEFNPDQSDYFFVIPDTEDLMQFLYVEDYDCELIDFEDGREWSVTFTTAYGMLSGRGQTLWDALIFCSVHALENQKEYAA